MGRAIAAGPAQLGMPAGMGDIGGQLCTQPVGRPDHTPTRRVPLEV